MEGINYSPVSKMDISSLNEKALNALKYHQLLKLSHKYNLKKRWAKKDDLIKCLLTVKTKLQGSSESQDNVLNEEIEWTDGREIFKDSTPLPEIQHARSTFTVEKDLLNDSRATYSLAQTINDILPDLKLSEIVDSRLTFDVPKPPRAKTSMSAKSSNPQKPKIKMLTVPSSGRATSRPNGTKPAPVKESPLKLSNRSIAIKKPKDVLSPMKSVRTLLTEKQRPVLRSSLPRLRPDQRSTSGSASKTVTISDALSLPRNETVKVQKENSIARRPSLPRRKSKSDDPNVRRLSGPSAATAVASFLTPPTAADKKRLLTKKTEFLSGVKPIVANKVPNFAAIHQRQFEKMDSLDEYISKKSERAKKLFGTPITSRPVDKVLKPRNNQILEDVAEETGAKKAGAAVRSPRVKTTLDEARKMMNRNPQLRTQTDVKDKNRSHIHGIRTNRRFELQMKFRNI